MKNVLILAYFFPPAPLAFSQRIGKLCKYLVRETDWLPQVICGELPWDILPGRDDVLLAEIPSSVSIERVGSFVASKLATRLRSLNLYKPIGLMRKLLIRPDAFGDWIGRAVAAAHRKFSNGASVDAILASGPPNSAYVAAGKLSEAWGKPLILDMRDPWTLDRWYSRFTKSMERSLYEQAGAIIVNTESAAAELKSRHPEVAYKLEVIFNGFDPEDLNWNLGPSLHHPDEPKETVHLLNLGCIRGSAGAQFLKVVAAYLQEEPDERHKLKVHFVGVARQEMEKIATPFGLLDICEAYGLVPTNHVGRPLAEADIYTLLQPGQFEASIPSKLFYYLAGGKLILAMVPAALAKEISGKMANYQDIIEFTNENNGKIALAKLVKKARDSKGLITGDSFPSYSLPYDRRTIARQVGSVMDKLMGKLNQ